MTRSDLLARLEKAESQLQNLRDYVIDNGGLHGVNCPGDDTCDCADKPKNDAANYLCSKEFALALAEARAALEIQNVWIVIQDCEVPGAQPGIRGVFPSQADAEAEIAAIRAEHPDLDRGDFYVQVERIRPPLPAPPSEDPS